jgi:hypothetical protein
MCIPEDYPEDEYATPDWLRPGSADHGGHGVTAVGTAGESAAEGRLVVERMPITYEGYTYPHGHIAYIEGAGPKPVVLVHPNCASPFGLASFSQTCSKPDKPSPLHGRADAGLKQFDIDQCCFLARCGYAAMCVDHYRETELYAFEDRNPRRSHHAGTAIPLELNKDQRAAARRHGVGAFTCMNDALQHPKHWRGLMKANLEMAWAHPAVESGLAAAIGYCFGGQVRYMCKCKCKRALWQTGPPTLTHRCLTACSAGVHRASARRAPDPGHLQLPRPAALQAAQDQRRRLSQLRRWPDKR